MEIENSYAQELRELFWNQDDLMLVYEPGADSPLTGDRYLCYEDGEVIIRSDEVDTAVQFQPTDTVPSIDRLAGALYAYVVDNPLLPSEVDSEFGRDSSTVGFSKYLSDNGQERVTPVKRSEEKTVADFLDVIESSSVPINETLDETFR